MSAMRLPAHSPIAIDETKIDVGRCLVFVICCLTQRHNFLAQRLSGLVKSRKDATNSRCDLQANERKQKFQMI